MINVTVPVSPNELTQSIPYHNRERCLLCGNVAKVTCVFYPDDSVKYGGVQGVRRYFGYGLCRKCETMNKEVNGELTDNYILDNIGLWYPDPNPE